MNDDIWKGAVLSLICIGLVAAVVLGVAGTIALVHATSAHGTAVCALRDALVKLVQGGERALPQIAYYKTHIRELHYAIQQDAHSIAVLQALSCRR